MSDRALLDEIINLIFTENQNENSVFVSYGKILEKAKEIRTRMAAAQPICKYEFPRYYCELEMYDGDCSHCTDKLECFQPKEKKDGN